MTGRDEKRITFEIDEEGNVALEGHGFHGPECERHIQDLSQALGTPTQVHRKPEYDMRQMTRQMQRGGR